MADWIGRVEVNDLNWLLLSKIEKQDKNMAGQ
jgi:hypothetical protein